MLTTVSASPLLLSWAIRLGMYDSWECGIVPADLVRDQRREDGVELGRLDRDLGDGLVDPGLPQGPDRRRDRHRHGHGQDQPDPPPHGPQVVGRAPSPPPGWSREDAGTAGGAWRPGRPLVRRGRVPANFLEAARFRPWVPPERVPVFHLRARPVGAATDSATWSRAGADWPCGRRTRGLSRRARETRLRPCPRSRPARRRTPRPAARPGRSSPRGSRAPTCSARWTGTTPAVRPAPGRAARGSGRRCPPPGPARGRARPGR